MRIAFLSSLNPTNIRNWSGTLYYIFRTLEKHHEIEWVGGELVSQVRSFRQSNFFNGSERFYPETYYIKD